MKNEPHKVILVPESQRELVESYVEALAAADEYDHERERELTGGEP